MAGSPAAGVPQLLTSFGDFQNIYGGYGNLNMKSASAAQNVHYMAMAVKAFFDNGGSTLYVSRVYGNNPGTAANTIDPGIASGTAATGNVVVSGRFPGAFLNNQSVAVTLTPTKTSNVTNLPLGSLVAVPGSGGGAATFYANGARPASQTNAFMSNAATPAPLSSPPPANLYVLTLQVTAPGASGQAMVYSNLGMDQNHPNYIGTTLGVNPPRPIDQIQNQISFSIGGSITAPDKLFTALFPNFVDPSILPVAWLPGKPYTAGQIVIDPNGNAQTVTTAATSGSTQPAWNQNSGQNTTDGGVTWQNLGPWRTFTFNLAGGDDGAEPVAANYTAALQYLQPLEDIAIVGTPGASIYTDSADIMTNSLIPEVEATRAYRVAILEAGPGLLDSGYENIRAQIDSTYSALYVPWIYTANPLAVAGTSIPAQILVPPTGFMAGIYARSDTQNSVAKAPANEIILGASDLERHISFAEQTILNPLGINCLRYFPDRGYRVWGARTATSNTELMYVNVRRYLVYLEHSIDNGTQWAVFENNGPALWARVTDSIDSFLNNEFAQGNLLGTSASNAYFVRCDRTTMTQNDLDNGRMICIIGVAVLKPAEFVIFRIGQMTASSSS
jgi:phage tail sheath protein FI